jgi:hypothetical protein
MRWNVSTKTTFDQETINRVRALRSAGKTIRAVAAEVGISRYHVEVIEHHAVGRGPRPVGHSEKNAGPFPFGSEAMVKMQDRINEIRRNLGFEPMRLGEMRREGVA